MESFKNIENFESREKIIDDLIEDLAKKEYMDTEDIFSDIITFWELSKDDEDAKAYFEELAEKIGISIEEMLKYAEKKSR